MGFYLPLNQWNKVITDGYKLFKLETYKILLYLEHEVFCWIWKLYFKVKFMLSFQLLSNPGKSKTKQIIEKICSLGCLNCIFADFQKVAFNFRVLIRYSMINRFYTMFIFWTFYFISLLLWLESFSIEWVLKFSLSLVWNTLFATLLGDIWLPKYIIIQV